MNKKILIVDDEEPIRGLLGQILEAQGYACFFAADASEAREFLEQQIFELILCDIIMPGELGLDFIREVLTKYQDTAVIMVTAIDDPLVAEAALHMGVYGYITKPIERNEVVINVVNALRRRELEIANRTYREDLETMVSDRTSFLIRLETMLEQLHSPQVAKELIKKIDDFDHPNKIREKLEMTVLFADIRGFSSMVSVLKLEDIVDFLDEFYSAMAKTVFDNEGSIDKFIGDEVMAFFGAPIVLENPTENGIKTAMEMEVSFQKLRKRFSRYSSYFENLGIGIGINTGEVFIGNVGSKKRYDYTVIGTAVNITRRLCSWAGPDQILTTKETLNKIPGIVSSEFVENISFKGIPKPVNVYKIIHI
ncbi:MAG: response regulator [Deltaproteobacteria bacterium]|nr:response regulator [Deltaproteobacteria bacterium]MBW2310707.1 response regulator [Deltaproteobacteria bacterium]